jgi:hypothetical protein
MQLRPSTASEQTWLERSPKLKNPRHHSLIRGFCFITRQAGAWSGLEKTNLF